MADNEKIEDAELNQAAGGVEEDTNDPSYFEVDNGPDSDGDDDMVEVDDDDDVLLCSAMPASAKKPSKDLKSKLGLL